MVKKMENGMDTGRFRRVILGFSLGYYPPIMENQMEKQKANGT